MVDKVKVLMDKIVEKIEHDTSDMDRIDFREVGEMVDMVKDLAEAEKNCSKAMYYRSVAEAMSTKSTTKATGRHEDLVSKLAEEYSKLTESEKMAMKGDVLSALGSM